MLLPRSHSSKHHSSASPSTCFPAPFGRRRPPRAGVILSHVAELLPASSSPECMPRQSHGRMSAQRQKALLAKAQASTATHKISRARVAASAASPPCLGSRQERHLTDVQEFSLWSLCWNEHEKPFNASCEDVLNAAAIYCSAQTTRHLQNTILHNLALKQDTALSLISQNPIRDAHPHCQSMAVQGPRHVSPTGLTPPRRYNWKEHSHADFCLGKKNPSKLLQKEIALETLRPEFQTQGSLLCLRKWDNWKYGRNPNLPQSGLCNLLQSWQIYVFLYATPVINNKNK